jgi:hypothetical protein
VYEAAERLVEAVNRAEADLPHASTGDLYAAVAARFG